MSADYIIEDAENEGNELKRKNLLEEAAVHIIEGMPRKAAKKHVTEIDGLREEAERDGNVIRDEDGFVVQYLESDLNPPSQNGIDRKKLYTIHKELCELEGVEFP